MARICITDLFVPDDLIGSVLQTISATMEDDLLGQTFAPVGDQSTQPPSPVGATPYHTLGRVTDTTSPTQDLFDLHSAINNLCAKLQPVNGQSSQPNIRVDKAVVEAEDIASRCVVAPDAETAELIRRLLGLVK